MQHSPSAQIKWRFSQSAQGMDHIDEAAVAVKLVSSCGLEFNIGSLQHFGSKKEYPPTFLEKDYKKKKQIWRAPQQEGRTERSAGAWSRVKVVESTSRCCRKSMLEHLVEAWKAANHALQTKSL